MPTYDFHCQECNNVWDDIIAYSDPNPNCPECKSNNVTRPISLIAHGKVRLYGQDYIAAINKGKLDAYKRASKDENFAANLVGEQKYQANKVQTEKDKNNRPKIKSSRKK